MKLNTIKNAYIKNKPEYNYQIKDDEGILVAKGHLMNARDKQVLTKMIQTSIDQNGNTITNIRSPLDMSIKTILLSLDNWQLELPLNEQTISSLDQNVIVWFVNEINERNFSSIKAVEQNEKN